MIILAGALILSISNSKVLNSADKAKVDTEIANEKEILNFCVVWSKVNHPQRILTVDSLNEELIKYDAQAIEQGKKILVTFNKSKRTYEVDADGKFEAISNEVGTDDLRFVYTGLDASGKSTTVENDIVSYMIGDGTIVSGNGLKDKSNIETIKIPTTYKNKPVVRRGANAFSGVNLKKLDLGERIEIISEQAFMNCYLLQQITLGKMLNSVELNAFRNCPSLQTVTINTETEGVIFNEFWACSSFVNLTINENNPTYKVEDNILYSKDGKTIYLVPVGRSGNLNIKQGVETIASKAFAGNKYMEEVIFASSVKTISNNAFYESNIKKVDLSGNIESVGDKAFAYCYQLKEVILGNNLKSLGKQTFENCTILSSLTVNTEAEGLIFDQFKLCPNLKTIITSTDNETYKVVDNILYSIDGKTLYFVAPGRNGVLTINEGVETIYNGALSNNKLLQMITFSSSVKTIKADAFNECNIRQIDLSGNIERLGDRAFANCERMTSAIIGVNLNNIGEKAFDNCTTLYTVTIDSSAIAKELTSQTSAGHLITFAQTIYIKDGITDIGSYVTGNFDVATSDKTGYVKYIKK